MDSILQYLMNNDTAAIVAACWVGFSTIVTGASTVVKGLEKIANVTPSTKDDEYVSKAKRVLGNIANLIEKVSLNTK